MIQTDALNERMTRRAWPREHARMNSVHMNSTSTARGGGGRVRR